MKYSDLQVFKSEWILNKWGVYYINNDQQTFSRWITILTSSLGCNISPNVLEEKPLYRRIVVVVFYRLQQKNTKYSQEKSKKVYHER